MYTVTQASGATVESNQSPPARTPQLLPLTSAALTTILTAAGLRLRALKAAYQAHPLLLSFFFCQIICSSVPIVLFFIGVVCAAFIATSVFACIAFLFVGPVLVFTSLLGLCVWVSFWTGWISFRWAVGLLTSVKYPGEAGYITKKEENEAKMKETEIRDTE